MKCLHPISIYVPDIEDYGESGYINVPCGKCEACRNSDSLSWRVRLLEHFNKSQNAWFVTLTYSTDKLYFEQCTVDGINYGWHPVVSKKDVQLFFMRLRKEFYKYDKNRKISYFLVSEYCPSSLRPHYHFLLFDAPFISSNLDKQKIELLKIIEEKWANGFVKLDLCNENRIAYCTKYMSCTTVIPNYLPKPFRLMSKSIGASFIDEIKKVSWMKQHFINYYPYGKLKYKLPRYYKDKIFTDDEKAIIRQIAPPDDYTVQVNQKDREKAVIVWKEKVKTVSNFKRIYQQKAIKRKLNG